MLNNLEMANGSRRELGRIATYPNTRTRRNTSGGGCVPGPHAGIRLTSRDEGGSECRGPTTVRWVPNTVLEPSNDGPRL